MASKEAKIKFFSTPSGVHRLAVPRNEREAMQYERVPQLFDAMCREWSAQTELRTHELVERLAFPDQMRTTL